MLGCCAAHLPATGDIPAATDKSKSSPKSSCPQNRGAHPVRLLGEPKPYWQVVPIPNSKEKPARIKLFCPFPGGRGSQTEDGVPKRMMPSFLCLLSYDGLSDRACVFLFVSMHHEAELPTQEDIPTRCGMATQDKMVTQYETAE